MAARTRKNGVFRYELLVLQHLVAAPRCPHGSRCRDDRMPKTIGRNSSVSTGSTRVAAPIGRRMTTPHAPPDN